MTEASDRPGSVEVCYPNPKHLLGSIVECVAPSSGTLRHRIQGIYGGKCCSALSLTPGQVYGPIDERIDPLCATAQSGGTVSAGVLADTDGDFTPDIVDDCPTLSNLQSDKDGDGIGDACDNCPSVYNPDQADTNDNGVGDVCEGGAPGSASAAGAGGLVDSNALKM